MFFRLSPNLALRSRWRPYRAKASEQVLTLRCGTVFSPGHPTTRLCLNLLKDSLARRQVKRLVDVGCGTGVLALAAAALGVPRVVGVDISWQAALVSWENTRANNLAGTLSIIKGSTDCLRGPFALVVANLPFAVQREKVTELCRLADGQAELILSGFRDTQEQILLEAYEASGFSLHTRLTQDEWPLTLPPEGSFTWVGWTLERCKQPRKGKEQS